MKFDCFIFSFELDWKAVSAIMLGLLFLKLVK